jgi:putative methyltransferase (TIGR04325 family)
VSNFDVVIFASSLCYLASPQDAVREVLKLEPKRVIIDRTPESKTGKDLIGVQKSGGALYKASYPIHVFAHGSLQKMMGEGFDLVGEWVSEFQPDPQTIYKGYVFQNVH